MSHNHPDTFHFTDDDVPLGELPHSYGQAAAWIAEGMQDDIATFDLVVREMPPHRNFLVFAGLEEMLDSITKFRFTDDHISYLKKFGVLKDNSEDYFRNFRFRGDVWAMKEGSIFFPGEPVVRITAPVIEAMMMSLLLVNTLVSHTIFTSKFARVYLAAKGKFVGTGTIRAHSQGAGLRATRASGLFGMPTGAIPNFNRKFFVPGKSDYVNAQHAFIKSFPDELSAMRAFVKQFPEGAGLMIDTYNITQGLQNAITVAKELQKQGHALYRVIIDSGDILKSSQHARTELDRHGLQDVKIMVASNLDEYKIERLAVANAPIDHYVVVTEVMTVSDAPKLEVIYKMAEIEHGDDKRPTAKLAPGKETYPGVKQVFRNYDTDGKMTGDIIGLADETLGEKRLHLMMQDGELIVTHPSFTDIHKYVDSELEKLPKKFKDLHHEYMYPVKISEKLAYIFDEFKAKHQG